MSSSNKVSQEVVATSNAQGASKGKRMAVLKRLLGLAAPEYPKIALGLLALIVNSVTNLSFPWIIGRALDQAEAEELKTFILGSAGYFLAGSVASWLRVYCLGTATENIANTLRQKLFDSFLVQDMEFYEKTQLGEIVSLLETDVQLSAELLTDKTANGLRSANSSFNGSYLLYSTSPKLTAVTLSIVPLVGVGAMTLSRYSRNIANKLRGIQSDILSYSMERVRNISTVRLNNRETYEQEKFAGMLVESKQYCQKRYNAHGSFMSFVNLSTNCALLAVLRVGGSMIAKNEITVGTLTSFAIQVSYSSFIVLLYIFS